MLRLGLYQESREKFEGARLRTMKLAVIFGIAGLLGWVEAGDAEKQKVLNDFADKSDLQLRELSKLAQVAGSDLLKEIGESVGEKNVLQERLWERCA